jgi:hypothetical protein
LIALKISDPIIEAKLPQRALPILVRLAEEKKTSRRCGKKMSRNVTKQETRPSSSPSLKAGSAIG